MGGSARRARRAAGPPSGRRWARRVTLATGVVGVAVVLRKRKLAENTRRFGLPG